MNWATRRLFSIASFRLAIMCIVLVLAACGAPGAGTGQPAAGSGATTAPAGGSNATGGQTIKIGAVIPLTGRYAAGGEQIKNGYELAVEAINKAGGVTVGGTKMPLELITLDDESDPTKTVQRLETLFSSNNVVAYLGGFGSDLHAAAAAIAEKNKVPYIGVAFALQKVHEQGFKYLFSPFPKSPSLAIATFDLLDTLSPKPSKIAIFAEKTDWGAELRGLWDEQAKKRGYTVAADQEYAPGSKDFSPVILAAKNAGAEVVLALPNPPDGMALAKQMKELDFNANMYIFIRAADGLSWSQGLGKDGDYFLNMPGWNPAVKFTGVQEMVQAHQAKYNKPAQATTGPAYAAVQILADAISRAGSLDRDKIRDAIAATDMATVAGPVKFNADGTGQVITVINQWQDGKQVLVWPSDQAPVKVSYPAKPWKER
jgi:branched-chain amino acid transport system substrate-binding protein